MAFVLQVVFIVLCALYIVCCGVLIVRELIFRHDINKYGKNDK